MYADKITDSMQLTIDETERRRSIQLAYNEEHGITPQAIVKARNRIIGVDSSEETTEEAVRKGSAKKPVKATREARREMKTTAIYDNEFSTKVDLAADPVVPYMNRDELMRTITARRMAMVEAAKKMQFMEAAQLRDEVLKLEERLKEIS